MDVSSAGKHLRIIDVRRLFCIVLYLTTHVSVHVRKYWLSAIAVTIDQYRLNRIFFIIIPLCLLCPFSLALLYIYI